MQNLDSYSGDGALGYDERWFMYSSFIWFMVNQVLQKFQLSIIIVVVTTCCLMKVKRTLCNILGHMSQIQAVEFSLFKDLFAWSR